MSETGALRRGPRARPGPFCRVRTHGTRCLRTRKQVLTKHQICLMPLILDFQPPEQQELNARCLSCSLWYFIIGT